MLVCMRLIEWSHALILRMAHAERCMCPQSSFTQDPCMGMHADCGHMIMPTSMAVLNMQVML